MRLALFLRSTTLLRSAVGIGRGLPLLTGRPSSHLEVLRIVDVGLEVLSAFSVLLGLVAVVDDESWLVDVHVGRVGGVVKIRGSP